MSTTTPGETMNQRPGPTSRRTTVLIVLAAISLVAVPLALSEGHREVARWYQADAEEKQLDGDLEGAVESLDKAIEWNDDSEIYLQRADTRLDRGDVEGCIEDCDLVIERTSQGPYQTLAKAYGLRSRARLKTGEYATAVDDQKKIGELLAKQPRLMKRSSYLNSLAYYRVLGEIELAEAEQEANKAVELLGGEDRLEDALLRCYLECDWSDAPLVFAEVTSDMQRRFTTALRASSGRIYEEMSENFPPAGNSREPAERMARDHRKAAGRLQLLQLRRAKPQVSGGNAWGDEASQPDAAVQRALDSLPELPQAMQILSEFGQHLDTRGFIFLKLAGRNVNQPEAAKSRRESARADLDRAVVAMEVAMQTTRTLMAQHAHESVDTRWQQAEMKLLKHSVAVIRYHRGLLWQSLGKHLLAARDMARVKQLGFEPNDQLY